MSGGTHVSRSLCGFPLVVVEQTTENAFPVDRANLLGQTLVVLGTEFGRSPSSSDGWDHRTEALRRIAVPNQAMIALLADFESKALLNQTLVVLSTEFGRRPRINDNDGRDCDDWHSRACWPGLGSTVRGR